MKSRVRTLLASASAVCLLAACDVEIQVRVFLSDLVNLVQGGSGPRYTGATVAMESAGEESRDNQIALLGRSFKGAQNFRARSEDEPDTIMADVELPLVRAETVESPRLQGDFLAVVARKEQGGIRLGVFLDTDRFAQINDEASDLFGTRVSVKDLAISLDLTNDLPSAIQASLGSVYVNGIPAPFATDFKANPREALSIRLSDVLRDSMESRDPVYFAFVRVPD